MNSWSCIRCSVVEYAQTNKDAVLRSHSASGELARMNSDESAVRIELERSGERSVIALDESSCTDCKSDVTGLMNPFSKYSDDCSPETGAHKRAAA